MKKDRRVEKTVYTLLIVLMLLALPLAVPSGAVLLSAENAYNDNISLLSDAIQEEPAAADAALVVSAGGGSAPEATAAPAALPMDFTAGMLPNPACYTEDSYQDASITVTMEHREVEGSMCHIAHVKITDSSQLRTGLAGPFGSNRTNKTSTLAKNNNAVVAMNGDYYTNNDKGNYLYVARQGQILRTPSKDKGSLHVLVVDSHGDFHILISDKMAQFAAMMADTENPILQAFTFGPALVIDGVVQEMPESYLFDIRRPNPRSAIGQVGPLEYVMVAVDGRLDDSPGLALNVLADFMKELGCTQAFNLDGGNSSALIFNNAFYSYNKINSERSTSDIIYFASAVDPASWQ